MQWRDRRGGRGQGAGGECPPTSDREISGDLPGKIMKKHFTPEKNQEK